MLRHIAETLLRLGCVSPKVLAKTRPPELFIEHVDRLITRLDLPMKPMGQIATRNEDARTCS